MSDNQLELFEAKLDSFIKLSRLSYNDNILWYDILCYVSKCSRNTLFSPFKVRITE
jgi:hypothetical protein